MPDKAISTISKYIMTSPWHPWDTEKSRELEPFSYQEEDNEKSFIDPTTITF